MEFTEQVMPHTLTKLASGGSYFSYVAVSQLIKIQFLNSIFI